MKYILFLGFVSLSSAFLTNFDVQRTIRVDGDRRIVLLGAKKIVIFNVPRDDPTSIDIVVKHQDKVIKIIKINSAQQIVKNISVKPGNEVDKTRVEESETEKINNDERSTQRTSQTKSDNPQIKVLINIFKKYEGISGELAFYNLLKEVKQSVERQELPSIIYDVLSDLEVEPTNANYVAKHNLEINTPEVQEATTENQLNVEDIKLSDSRDQKRSTHVDHKSKLTDAAEASSQIEWIQSLLENRRNQQLADTNNNASRHEDLIRDTDAFLQASLDYINHKKTDFKQMVLQISILELQREITETQLKAQQLQIQQQFLSEQKQQLKLQKHTLDKQGLETSQTQELQEAYDKVKTYELKLAEEQLDIQKIVYKLQERLIKQNEKLKDELRRGDNREERNNV